MMHNLLLILSTIVAIWAVAALICSGNEGESEASMTKNEYNLMMDVGYCIRRIEDETFRLIPNKKLIREQCFKTNELMQKNYYKFKDINLYKDRKAKLFTLNNLDK